MRSFASREDWEAAKGSFVATEEKLNAMVRVGQEDVINLGDLEGPALMVTAEMVEAGTVLYENAQGEAFAVPLDGVEAGTMIALKAPGTSEQAGDWRQSPAFRGD